MDVFEILVRLPHGGESTRKVRAESRDEAEDMLASLGFDVIKSATPEKDEKPEADAPVEDVKPEADAPVEDVKPEADAPVEDVKPKRGKKD